jgi:hypothetical protein
MRVPHRFEVVWDDSDPPGLHFFARCRCGLEGDRKIGFSSESMRLAYLFEFKHRNDFAHEGEECPHWSKEFAERSRKASTASGSV